MLVTFFLIVNMAIQCFVSQLCVYCKGFFLLMLTDFKR